MTVAVHTASLNNPRIKEHCITFTADHTEILGQKGTQGPVVLSCT